MPTCLVARIHILSATKGDLGYCSLLNPTKGREATLAYHQITREERYTIWALRRKEISVAEIARPLGRHRSTIHREIRRNCGRADGFYRPLQAHGYARTRRSHSRRNFRLTDRDWGLVELLIRMQDWSPEQIAGRQAPGRLPSSTPAGCTQEATQATRHLRLQGTTGWQEAHRGPTHRRRQPIPRRTLGG